MKLKLNLLILFGLILLILFMVNVIGKLEDENNISNRVKVNTTDADSLTSDIIDEESISGEESLDNMPTNEDNKSSDKDSKPSDKDSSTINDDNLTAITAPAMSEDTTGTSGDLSKETSAVPMTRKSMRQLSAGTIIHINESGDTILKNSFYYEEIKDDIKERITGKSYKKDCTVPYEELRYVRVLYYGFDKETHIGELIVNKAIASDIIDIFAELYDKQYPIEQMVLVDEYDADDNTSMAADNTSSFNYRAVPGSTHLSKHALGLAIDINPLYNPYIQYNKDETVILPVEGTKYADRTLDCPYYINEDDLCYQAFTKRGFTWGGFWKTEPDYQHFQKTLD